MDATFWIETVESSITIPPFELGTKLRHLQPNFTPLEGSLLPPLPTFAVTPLRTGTEPRDVKVTYKQIQYAQIVFLSFAGLVWLHASVATFVPAMPIVLNA
jgi:hypothetical protein